MRTIGVSKSMTPEENNHYHNWQNIALSKPYTSLEGPASLHKVFTPLHFVTVIFLHPV
jgi:hypothetical protein